MTILAIDDNAESIKELADNLQPAFCRSPAHGKMIFVKWGVCGSGANIESVKHQFERI